MLAASAGAAIDPLSVPGQVVTRRYARGKESTHVLSIAGGRGSAESEDGLAPVAREALFIDGKLQIQDQQLAIDKKRFTRYWGQAVFGFSGPTPTSDGQHVCAFFTTGVSACYDLAGNRKWINRGPGGGSEHGNFASPVLCQNRLIVWANEM